MPIPPTITLSRDERTELEARVCARTGEQRDVERARIVLLAADGMANKDIAAALHLEPDTVSKVAQAFRRREDDWP